MVGFISIYDENRISIYFALVWISCFKFILVEYVNSQICMCMFQNCSSPKFFIVSIMLDVYICWCTFSIYFALGWIYGLFPKYVMRFWWMMKIYYWCLLLNLWTASMCLFWTDIMYCDKLYFLIFSLHMFWARTKSYWKILRTRNPIIKAWFRDWMDPETKNSDFGYSRSLKYRSLEKFDVHFISRVDEAILRRFQSDESGNKGP